MGEIIDRIKGRAKQVKGDLTDNSILHAEGVVDEMKGKVKGKIKDIKHAVKDITGK